MIAEAGSVYACSPAARWLPRALAGAVLTAGLIAASSVGEGLETAGARRLRILVALAAGVSALWLVRRGGEVRLRLVVGREALSLEHGRRQVELPYDEVASLRYEAPFGPSRSWLPAAVVTDRNGRAWRLSALLAGGERAIAELIERSERSDLATWAVEQRLGPRMARATGRVRLGYATAAAILAAGLLYALR